MRSNCSVPVSVSVFSWCCVSNTRSNSTDYVVRPSTGDERQVFQVQVCPFKKALVFNLTNTLKPPVMFVLQELQRYNQPHKAFTFRMHGFESVVGPVKGVFDKEMSLNKAREHTLLRSDRPPYVTILSLGWPSTSLFIFLRWSESKTNVFLLNVFSSQFVMQQPGYLTGKEHEQRSVSC